MESQFTQEMGRETCNSLRKVRHRHNNNIVTHDGCRPRAEMVSFEEDIDEEMVPMHHLSAGQRVAMMASYHSSNGQTMETSNQSEEWFV